MFKKAIAENPKWSSVERPRDKAIAVLRMIISDIDNNSLKLDEPYYVYAGSFCLGDGCIVAMRKHSADIRRYGYEVSLIGMPQDGQMAYYFSVKEAL